MIGDDDDDGHNDHVCSIDDDCLIDESDLPVQSLRSLRDVASGRRDMPQSGLRKSYRRQL